MKTKQHYLKVSLVLAALALLPLAFPATAEDQVPFKGIEVGAASFGSFDFPSLTITSTGEGEATHFGHYTVTGSIVINVLSGTVAGTFTLTSANGDMLFLTTSGEAPPPSDHPVTVDNVTITGGTGRFEGATGSWVQVGHAGGPFTGGPGTDPYVATLDGTISTPGANKK